MALGPKKLREPNPSDLEAVAALEDFVDSSKEFNDFRKGTVKVRVAPAWFDRFFNDRVSIRQKEFIGRYKEAGWFSVIFEKDGIVFSEIDPTEGRD